MAVDNRLEALLDNCRPDGALRLRNELELGFKPVKWIEAVEFVADFRSVGWGRGGYNKDDEYIGYRMPI